MVLRALLWQAFYTIRSEPQLVERIEFDLLFRWFVGLGMDERVWDVTTFTKSCDRLLAGEIARRSLTAVLTQPKVKGVAVWPAYLVDGTLLEGWASAKSSCPRMASATGRRGPVRSPGAAQRQAGMGTMVFNDLSPHRQSPLVPAWPRVDVYGDE